MRHTSRCKDHVLRGELYGWLQSHPLGLVVSLDPVKLGFCLVRPLERLDGHIQALEQHLPSYLCTPDRMGEQNQCQPERSAAVPCRSITLAHSSVSQRLQRGSKGHPYRIILRECSARLLERRYLRCGQRL